MHSRQCESDVLHRRSLTEIAAGAQTIIIISQDLSLYKSTFAWQLYNRISSSHTDVCSQKHASMFCASRTLYGELTR